MAHLIDLSGRTAWVTGGASGIGAAVVEALHQAGAVVVSLDRSHAAATRVEHGREVQMPLDVGDGAAVDAVVARLTADGLGPDILVNGAGITRDAVVWKLRDEDWDAVLNVNLTGAFRMTRAAVPLMREREGGAIVNIASINGLRGKFGQANYAASKGGLIAFTRAVAKEVGRFGIRVNAIAPGLIETPMTASLPEHVRAQAKAEVLLGRLGSPQDIASAVLFLASPLAAHVTGHILVVDGGQTV
jgi:NAD(P)-dependent dehydrogenase (short-subunit alcohol dehydrogenase family)